MCGRFLCSTSIPFRFNSFWQKMWFMLSNAGRMYVSGRIKFTACKLTTSSYELFVCLLMRTYMCDSQPFILVKWTLISSFVLVQIEMFQQSQTFISSNHNTNHQLKDETNTEYFVAINRRYGREHSSSCQFNVSFYYIWWNWSSPVWISEWKVHLNGSNGMIRKDHSMVVRKPQA